MILFTVLCIAAVIATMNESKQWMGLAVLGTVVIMLVQLCQLAAAVAVRRWWCVAGSVFGIIVSLFVLVCSIVALAAGQYRPPVISDDTDTTEVVTTDSICGLQEDSIQITE